MTSDISFIKTKKTVSQSLADLRRLFSRYSIEDWEPIPEESGPGYRVRYLRNKVWTEISSSFQPTKSMNLRVCYQVIDNMFRWESRGVGGIVKGTAFMGGELVATKGTRRESVDEACATLGVEPESSWEEIERVYRIKVQYAHPDKGGDAERFKRIQRAYELLKKVKGPKNTK